MKRLRRKRFQGDSLQEEQEPVRNGYRRLTLKGVYLATIQSFLQRRTSAEDACEILDGYLNLLRQKRGEQHERNGDAVDLFQVFEHVSVRRHAGTSDDCDNLVASILDGEKAGQSRDTSKKVGRDYSLLGKVQHISLTPFQHSEGQAAMRTTVQPLRPNDGEVSSAMQKFGNNVEVLSTPGESVKEIFEEGIREGGSVIVPTVSEADVAEYSTGVTQPGTMTHDSDVGKTERTALKKCALENAGRRNGDTQCESEKLVLSDGSSTTDACEKLSEHAQRYHEKPSTMTAVRHVPSVEQFESNQCIEAPVLPGEDTTKSTYDKEGRVCQETLRTCRTQDSSCQVAQISEPLHESTMIKLQDAASTPNDREGGAGHEENGNAPCPETDGEGGPAHVQRMTSMLTSCSPLRTTKDDPACNPSSTTTDVEEKPEAESQKVVESGMNSDGVKRKAANGKSLPVPSKDVEMEHSTGHEEKHVHMYESSTDAMEREVANVRDQDKEHSSSNESDERNYSEDPISGGQSNSGTREVTCPAIGHAMVRDHDGLNEVPGPRGLSAGSPWKKQPWTTKRAEQFVDSIFGDGAYADLRVEKKTSQDDGVKDENSASSPTVTVSDHTPEVLTTTTACRRRVLTTGGVDFVKDSCIQYGYFSTCFKGVTHCKGISICSADDLIQVLMTERQVKGNWVRRHSMLRTYDLCSPEETEWYAIPVQTSNACGSSWHLLCFKGLRQACDDLRMTLQLPGCADVKPHSFRGLSVIIGRGFTHVNRVYKQAINDFVWGVLRNWHISVTGKYPAPGKKSGEIRRVSQQYATNIVRIEDPLTEGEDFTAAATARNCLKLFRDGHFLRLDKGISTAEHASKLYELRGERTENFLPSVLHYNDVFRS